MLAVAAVGCVWLQERLDQTDELMLLAERQCEIQVILGIAEVGYG